MGPLLALGRMSFEKRSEELCKLPPFLPYFVTTTGGVPAGKSRGVELRSAQNSDFLLGRMRSARIRGTRSWAAFGETAAKLSSAGPRFLAFGRAGKTIQGEEKEVKVARVLAGFRGDWPIA